MFLSSEYYESKQSRLMPVFIAIQNILLFTFYSVMINTHVKHEAQTANTFPRLVQTRKFNI